MKNLQKLLIAAAFASVMPSTIIICSEETAEVPVTSSEESTETSSPTRVKVINVHQSDIENFIKGALILGVPVQCGLFGMIASLQGSHSLKKVKRALALNKDLSASGLKYNINTMLSKGIRNNRIGMAVSLATIASPFAILEFNGFLNTIKQDPANDDALLREMITRNEQFLASDAVKEMQEEAVNNITKDFQASTDKAISDLAKELGKETV